MSEQDIQTPPVEADTSIEVAPAGDTQPTPVVDFESRYNNLRPDYDRKSQRLAELEAEREQWLASQQEPEEDDGEYEEYDFEDSVARQRLEDLEARIAEREQAETLAAQQAEESAHIDSELEAIEKETQDEFSQEESDWIGNYALAHKDEHGKPDVRLAYKTYIDLIEGRKSKWISTKKAPRPGTGAAAKEEVKLDTSDDRSRYMAQRLEELDGGL